MQTLYHSEMVQLNDPVRHLDSWWVTIEGGDRDMRKVSKLVMQMPGYAGGTLLFSPSDHTGEMAIQFQDLQAWQTLLATLKERFKLVPKGIG